MELASSLYLLKDTLLETAVESFGAPVTPPSTTTTTTRATTPPPSPSKQAAAKRAAMEQKQEQQPDPWKWLYLLYSIVVFHWAVGLQWECSTYAGVGVAGKILYSFIAGIFGTFYLIYKYIFDNACVETSIFVRNAIRDQDIVKMLFYSME
jgi:hypothetical protein